MLWPMWQKMIFLYAKEKKSKTPHDLHNAFNYYVEKNCVCILYASRDLPWNKCGEKNDLHNRRHKQLKMKLEIPKFRKSTTAKYESMKKPSVRKSKNMIWRLLFFFLSTDEFRNTLKFDECIHARLHLRINKMCSLHQLTLFKYTFITHRNTDFSSVFSFFSCLSALFF